jgi:hypothetical protein
MGTRRMERRKKRQRIKTKKLKFLTKETRRKVVIRTSKARTNPMVTANKLMKAMAKAVETMNLIVLPLRRKGQVATPQNVQPRHQPSLTMRKSQEEKLDLDFWSWLSASSSIANVVASLEVGRQPCQAFDRHTPSIKKCKFDG